MYVDDLNRKSFTGSFGDDGSMLCEVFRGEFSGPCARACIHWRVCIHWRPGIRGAVGAPQIGLIFP